MTPNFARTLLGLLLLLLLALGMLSGCSSTPTFVSTPGPLIPPLPPQAKQTASPLECSPSCSARLTTLRERWRLMLTPPASQAAPAKLPTDS